MGEIFNEFANTVQTITEKIELVSNRTTGLEQDFVKVVEDRDRLRYHAAEREDEFMALKNGTVVYKVGLIFQLD